MFVGNDPGHGANTGSQISEADSSGLRGFSDHLPAGSCSKCQASDWSILVTWPQYWPLIGLNPGSQKRENYHHLCSVSLKYQPRYLDPDSSQTIYISDKLCNLRDFNFNKNQEQISWIISQMFGYFATMSKDMREIDLDYTVR